MALYQSEWAKGRKSAPVSREAGGVVAEKYTFTVSSDLSIGDKIELAILPAEHEVLDYTLVNDGLGASVTANLGIMSGDVGEDNASRTVGTEFESGLDVSSDAVTQPDTKGAFRVADSDDHRSIGLEIAGAGVTASNQVIDLILYTKQ